MQKTSPLLRHAKYKFLAGAPPREKRSGRQALVRLAEGRRGTYSKQGEEGGWKGRAL